MQNGIVVKMGLGEEDLKNIRSLNDACNQPEKLNMKLNWDMLETRSKDIGDDYFYYVEDKVIGYLGMYGFGKSEIEITGMVHPDYRRKGVFTELFSCAKKDCSARGIGRILVLCEGNIVSGTEFAKSLDSKYAFSEYRMERDTTYNEEALKHDIRLKPCTEEDAEFLINMDSIAFGTSIEETKDHWSNEKIWNATFMAEYKGVNIGKVRNIIEDGNGGIYGFAVLPEYRGKGYGREILNLAIKELLKLNPKKITLEVASENERALNLYKSCGFEVVTVYNYYEIALTE